MASESKVIVKPIEGTNIIFQKVFGDTTSEMDKEIYEKTEKAILAIGNPYKINIIVDTYDAGKTLSKARKSFNAVLQKDRVNKVAILGIKPFLRAMLKFHRIVSGVDKMRIFENRDEAIAWLKE
jgi:hypothetical protein